MGSSQNQSQILVPLDIRRRTIICNQKGPILLRTTAQIITKIVLRCPFEIPSTP